MTNYEEQQVTCQDCGATFIFSAEAQEFYAQKGYSTPKRCPQCRSARKNQNRGHRRGPRPQFTVTCSACGVETTVPFEPKDGRPVYCSECYKNGAGEHNN